MSPDVHVEDLHKKLSCCTGSLIGVSRDGTCTKIIPLFCHKWSCSRCRKTKTSLWRIIACSGAPERFITLTLKTDDGMSTLDQAHLIKKAFPKLVQKIRKVHGEFEYLLVFELTKKGTPHVHILQRGCYVPQAWLSTEWKKLTGSFIVDIRKIDSKSDVSRYLTKYMGKSIADVAEKLHGLRILQRSKNYVIPEQTMELPIQEREIAEVMDWYYCHAHPSQVLAAAKSLVPDAAVSIDGKGVHSIRGSPRPDLVHELIYWCTGYPRNDDSMSLSFVAMRDRD